MAHSKELVKAALHEINRRHKMREHDFINPPDRNDFILRMFDEEKINRLSEALSRFDIPKQITLLYDEVIEEFNIAEQYISSMEWTIMELQRR